MKISRILNNNAVVCVSDDGKEKIVMGCGIAFGQKTGSEVDSSKIEKEFVLKNKETNLRFQQFIQNIPMETILLAEKIIVNAREKTGKQFEDSIYITLTDHLNGALDRARKGIVIENPLVSAVKNFYPEEFKLAEDSLDFIQVETGIRLSVDEAGFITMHFVTAQLGNNQGNFAEVISFVNDISEEVKSRLMIVDETSISWRRFITHLTFFGQRLITKQSRPDEEDVLQIPVKNNFSKAYEIIETICNKLKEKYSFEVSENEKIYLTIHVNRLLKENGNLY